MEGNWMERYEGVLCWKEPQNNSMDNSNSNKLTAARDTIENSKKIN